jgi:excisionase family DNA binding protein
MTEEKYYTIEEVAKRLKVAYLTVYRWIQGGKLCAYKFGKQYRITRLDFESFKKKSKTKK